MSDFQPITVDGDTMTPNGALEDKEGRVWLIRYSKEELVP